MKIAHEAPLSIFNQVQRLTDYDYALVHLFEENEDYFRVFKDAINNGREVILDNSIFELGTAFDAWKFADWIHRLRPTWYIIPDVLEDANQTIKNVRDWVIPNWSKSIGVVQGKSYEEIKWCYQEIEPFVDKVAISFDYSFFIDEDSHGLLPTKYHHYMIGRRELLKQLVSENIINTNKPHHLLGCGLPQEFIHYSNYKWIDSIDTSNPVVHGIKGIKYHMYGLDDKESVKLFTLIDSEVVDKLDIIKYNILMFRAFCNGEA